MNQLIIKENKTIPRASIIISFCWIFPLGLNIIHGIKERDIGILWISACLFSVAIMIHIYFLMKYWFWRVELSTYSCCYQNRFKRRKEFLIRDVKQIGIRQKYIGLIKWNYLELMDQKGKIIVSINVLTAKNIELLIPFFEEYNTEVVIDESGRMTVASRMPDLQDHVGKRSERQVKRWRSHNKRWERKPAFYQKTVWMKRIRMIGWGLDGLMFAGIAAAQLCPRIVAAVVYAIIPLLLLTYFLLFHRVLVWRTPKETTRDWEEAHVVMPNVTLAMFPFFFWCPLRDMNFTLNDQIIFGLKLFLVSFAIFLLFTIVQRAWTRLSMLFLCLLCYSYTGTYCWNYLFPVDQEVICEDFTVLEKDKTDFLQLSQYRVRVYSEAEGEIQFRVSWDTWKDTETQDKLTFCIKESVFGIQYCYTELK